MHRLLLGLALFLTQDLSVVAQSSPSQLDPEVERAIRNAKPPPFGLVPSYPAQARRDTKVVIAAIEALIKRWQDLKGTQTGKRIGIREYTNLKAEILRIEPKDTSYAAARRALASLLAVEFDLLLAADQVEDLIQLTVENNKRWESTFDKTGIIPPGMNSDWIEAALTDLAKIPRNSPHAATARALEKKFIARQPKVIAAERAKRRN